MILGNTLKTLFKQVPGYRIVSPGIARTSLSVCTCRRCARCVKTEGHLEYGRVVGRLDDSERGYAIVAWNGSCDRAEFSKDDGGDVKLGG